MKKITFILIALITGTTFAQDDSATAPVNANIVSPITITSGTTGLDFGNIATPDAATDITVSNSGERTAVNGVTIPGGTVSAAGFTVNAALDYAYTISIPTIDLTSAVAGSGADMPVIFTHSGAVNAEGNNAAKGTGVDQTLNVGGTLKVGAGQAAGAYAGTVKVTVAYE